MKVEEIDPDAILIVSFDIKNRSAEKISLKDFIARLAMPISEKFYWMDVKSQDEDFFKCILTSLSIECSWEDHFDKPEILPHLKDNFSSITFYLYDLINVRDHFDSTKEIKEIAHAPYLLILAKDFVVTYHQRPLDVIDYIKNKCEDNFVLAGKSPVFIAFLFIHQSMYNYSRTNLANDNFLDAIETSVLENKRNQSMSDISVAGYNILMLKKMNANLHIILFMLVTKRNCIVSSEAQEFLKPMLRATEGIRSTIDSSRDLLDSIIGSVQAQASRKTNKVLHLLTLVSAIFMPLTLIAGIYGMNFVNMPELHWEYGYYLTLVVMLMIALGFLYFLKRNGGIGGEEGED